MTGWRVGDPMIMYFTIAGETTEDTCIVMEIDDDIVSLNDIFEEDGIEKYRKFDRKTGKCLNDETFAGGKRFIYKCWAKPDNYVPEVKAKPDISDFFEDEELPF